MPQKTASQIIGPTTYRRCREDYREAWNREWPETDAYLAQLVIEAKAGLGLDASSKAKPNEVRAETLVLMRLDHEF